MFGDNNSSSATPDTPTEPSGHEGLLAIEDRERRMFENTGIVGWYLETGKDVLNKLKEKYSNEIEAARIKAENEGPQQIPLYAPKLHESFYLHVFADGEVKFSSKSLIAREN